VVVYLQLNKKKGESCYFYFSENAEKKEKMVFPAR
jgi:hypothetical protein